VLECVVEKRETHGLSWVFHLNQSNVKVNKKALRRGL